MLRAKQASIVNIEFDLSVGVGNVHVQRDRVAWMDVTTVYQVDIPFQNPTHRHLEAACDGRERFS